MTAYRDHGADQDEDAADGLEPLLAAAVVDVFVYVVVLNLFVEYSPRCSARPSPSGTRPTPRHPPHQSATPGGGRSGRAWALGRRPGLRQTTKRSRDLVERHSRYVLLFPLPDGFTAPRMRPALTTGVLRLPQQLRRSLTWDHGKEMAEHAQFTVDSGVQVYFCDPPSPWQRGTNQNTNGLLRQDLPKSGDLRQLDQTALDAIAAELNGRPRQTLGFKTPSQALAEAMR